MATSNLLWWWLGIYKYGYSKGLLQMLWFGLQSFIDGSLICKIMVYNLAYNLCPCLANKKFQIVIHVKLDGMINPNYNPFEGSWLKFGASLYWITCCLVSVSCWCMTAILASCHIQPPFSTWRILKKLLPKWPPNGWIIALPTSNPQVSKMHICFM